MPPSTEHSPSEAHGRRQIRLGRRGAKPGHKPSSAGRCNPRAGVKRLRSGGGIRGRGRGKSAVHLDDLCCRARGWLHGFIDDAADHLSAREPTVNNGTGEWTTRSCASRRVEKSVHDPELPVAMGEDDL